MISYLRFIKAVLLRLFRSRELDEYKKRWQALTPRQKQAVAICHRAAARMQQMKREAQALMAELEQIAEVAEYPQRSREVAETLARRFNELYAAIEAIGQEHAREWDFLKYADRHAQDLGVYD
jgi:short-subunit dehydrogenase involved in D-alanine esterification of teichoic acids